MGGAASDFALNLKKHTFTFASCLPSPELRSLVDCGVGTPR